MVVATVSYKYIKGSGSVGNKYRKKPVVVEAMQLTDSNEIKVTEFMGLYEGKLTADGIEIETLEGTMKASIGDYIIKGVQGEFYPCKPDIFEQTYEKVN